MQAYKLKATIDDCGHLVINAPITMPPGNVDVIVWPSDFPTESSIDLENEVLTPKLKRIIEGDIPGLKAWLEKTEPAPPDFDTGQAK